MYAVGRHCQADFETTCDVRELVSASLFFIVTVTDNTCLFSNPKKEEVHTDLCLMTEEGKSDDRRRKIRFRFKLMYIYIYTHTYIHTYLGITFQDTLDSLDRILLNRLTYLLQVGVLCRRSQ